jgi:hypothetical protein
LGSCANEERQKTNRQRRNGTRVDKPSKPHAGNYLRAWMFTARIFCALGINVQYGIVLQPQQKRTGP